MTSQAEFIAATTPPRPVAGVVGMSLDSNGVPQAVDANNPMPVTLSSGGGAGGGGLAGPAEAGVSVKGTAGTTSAAIIAAGAFKGWVTIQNTHASQTLFVSFTAPATATDIAILPGAGLTLPFGPTNALNGIGSAAGTTFAAVGY
jgi:hypothetical protein